MRAASSEVKYFDWSVLEWSAAKPASEVVWKGEKAYFPDNAKLAGGVHLQFGGSLIASAGRWYALHVRARHEKVVENSLKGKGYPVFSPFYRTRRKRVDRNRRNRCGAISWVRLLPV
jgi:hypothetical protein